VEIRTLVARGAVVDELFEIQLDPTATSEPATALVVAAGSGEGASAETVSVLLELGASPAGAGGVPPLPYACAGLGWNYPPGGDAARAAVLLAAGADPNSTLMNGMSALACAAEVGDPERVRLLLEAGADPVPLRRAECDSRPSFLAFRDPLSMAAESASAACVRLLLETGASVDNYPDGAEHPLARARSLEALEALLAAGADPTYDQRGRASVAERVAQNARVRLEERVQMLRALRAAGADLDRSGDVTPLFAAALAADAEAVEALLAAGADPHREPTGMQGVSFSAFVGPHPGVDKVIDLLVEAGLRPLHAALAPDQYGPGYAESDGFNEPAALALLRHGADLHIVYPDTGYGPLHAAAAAGSVAVVSALLGAGADPNARTPEGQTALDIARQHGAVDCVEVLASTTRS
jgi:cytohesin